MNTRRRQHRIRHRRLAMGGPQIWRRGTHAVGIEVVDSAGRLEHAGASQQEQVHSFTNRQTVPLHAESRLEFSQRGWIDVGILLDHDAIALIEFDDLSQQFAGLGREHHDLHHLLCACMVNAQIAI